VRASAGWSDQEQTPIRQVPATPTSVGVVYPPALE
jgi:hypothetical protein